jgi:hypothetical protein
MAFSRADALDAVERSPSAFEVHDREGWVGAFTYDGRVEDPVGSQPHRGRTAITRFYDTFIGPRDITFHRDTDIVVGPTVIRDLELEVRMASGLTMRIPAYLRYDLKHEHGELKIAELCAFWELPAMVGQFLRGGVRALPAGLQLSKGLLTNQGLIGTAGFLAGFRGTGPQGKRRFRQFLADAKAGDEVSVRRWLGKGARITSGDHEALGTAELLSRLAGARPRKLIASGYSLIVGLDRDGRRDVLSADVTAKPFAINTVRYFSEQD